MLVLLLANLVILVGLVGMLSAGLWTYLDSSDRGAGKIAPLWGAGVAGFVPLAVFYLYFRGHIGARTEPPSTAEDTLAVTAIGCLFASIGALSGGMITPLFAEIDAVTLGWYALGLLPVGIVLGYLVVYGPWFGQPRAREAT